MNKTAERMRIKKRKKRRKIIERWDHGRMGPKKIRKQRATATRRKEDRKRKGAPTSECKDTKENEPDREAPTK